MYSNREGKRELLVSNSSKSPDFFAATNALSSLSKVNPSSYSNKEEYIQVLLNTLRRDPFEVSQKSSRDYYLEIKQALAAEVSPSDLLEKYKRDLAFSSRAHSHRCEYYSSYEEGFLSESIEVLKKIIEADSFFSANKNHP